MAEEEIPIRVYEEKETLDLLEIYRNALLEAHPEYSDIQIIVLSEMVVKKAKFGIEYESEVEKLISEVNNSIRDYYSTVIED
jgi:hypothetical protein